MQFILLSVLLCFTYSCMVQQEDSYTARRLSMVQTQVAARGVTHRQTLKAMQEVPRHLFVPAELRHVAYTDGPLPIGLGQTISQPYIVAFMTEAVKPKKGMRALEIGTGSGYQAAILAQIVDTVYTIEIVKELSEQAQSIFEGLDYRNIVAKHGDGYKGWPQHAPFDIILVTAAPDHIPQPLIDQLSEGGRMVIPVGKQSEVQELLLLTKSIGAIRKQTLLPVRFVPFTRDE